MTTIYQPGDSFNFKDLQLTDPRMGKNNGEYLSSFRFKGVHSDIFFQAPRCTVDKEIDLANKIQSCNVQFSAQEEEFSNWIEEIVSWTVDYMFTNQSTWFVDSQMTKEFLSDHFSYPLKPVKSGKLQMMMLFDNMTMTMYDENKKTSNIKIIRANDNMVPIVKLRGIRCEGITFYLEMEMMQVMITPPFLSQCRIIVKEPETKQHFSPPLDDDVDSIISDSSISREYEEEVRKQELHRTRLDRMAHVFEGLEEVELDLEETPDPVSIYLEAKERAKRARDQALSLHLESKRVKNHYAIEDVSEDEDEEDEF